MDIDAHEPVGEPFEVRASEEPVEMPHEASALDAADGGASSVATTALPTRAAGAPGRTIPLRRRV